MKWNQKQNMVLNKPIKLLFNSLKALISKNLTIYLLIVQKTILRPLYIKNQQDRVPILDG